MGIVFLLPCIVAMLFVVGMNSLMCEFIRVIRE